MRCVTTGGQPGKEVYIEWKIVEQDGEVVQRIKSDGLRFPADPNPLLVKKGLMAVKENCSQRGYHRWSWKPANKRTPYNHYTCMDCREKTEVGGGK